uniref:MAM domain-containing protein n=1 Tax=Latimeria chalumnae TaxID=7897 RepID=H3B3Q2_LATCH
WYKTHHDNIVWIRTGTQGKEWTYVQITIQESEPFKIKLSGSRTNESRGFITVDDSSLVNGECTDHDSCDFETLSLCNYEQGVADNAHWIHVEGSDSGPPVDHTYGTNIGMAMVTNGTKLKQTAQLLSPEHAPTMESCIRFWFCLAANHESSLSVHTMQSETLRPALWSLSGNVSRDWDVAEVTVSSALHFMIVFRGELDSTDHSFIALDDISIRAGICQYTGSCDFEKDQCTWLNTQGDDFDWIRASGHLKFGPSIDHTTQTSQGKYMLAETQWHPQGQQAVLLSERFEQTGMSCITLWYFIKDSLQMFSDLGLLSINLRSGTAQSDLIFQTSDSGNKWKEFSAKAYGPKGFQVLFHQVAIVVESAGNGYIAIDDIKVVQGVCGVTEVDFSIRSIIKDFVNCDFEIDACEWADVSKGQFKWQRGQNGTASSNTGPSTDHTTGSKLGWYMAVEADNGDRYSYAVLMSTGMQQASAECLMEFYYHMYGTGIGELRVLLREGSRDTLLWIASGNKGNRWNRAAVGIGRMPAVFQLLIEATRTFSTLGDIAIDDIIF